MPWRRWSTAATAPCTRAMSPDEAEATYMVNQVALILRETGRWSKPSP